MDTEQGVTSRDERRGEATGVAVVVRGTEGPIGERVAQLLTERGYWVVTHSAADAVAVVDALVGDYDLLGSAGLSPVVEVAKTLDHADATGATHVIVISSAMVYGALPNNPLPITEEEVLRPPSDFDYCRLLATAEELVEDWRRERPDRRSAILRPAIPVSERHSSSLARALLASLGQQSTHADPPAQFVHLDDVASAAVLAVCERLDGVFNVAPDGWIAGERLAALASQPPRLRLPGRLAEVVSALQWRFQRGPIPPGLRPYLRHPWVVANDKLRQHGWSPTVSNEEAFVEGTEAPWWSMITPKRRQELALGAVAGVLIVAVAALVGAVGWRRRRR